MNLSLYLLTVLIWGTTDRPETPAGRGRHSGLDRLPLCLGRADPVRLPAAHPAPAADEPTWPPDLHGRGLCLFCVNFICFLSASQWIASGLIAVVFSTATLWNALNARIFFGQKIASNVLGGGALGLLGTGLLFWPELSHQAASRETLYGLGTALLGTLCFSAGNMLSSMQQKAGLKPMTTNARGMVYGAAMLAVFCVVSGVPFSMEWNVRYIGSLLYLVVPGSVIAFTAYLTWSGAWGRSGQRTARCCSRWWR